MTAFGQVKNEAKQSQFTGLPDSGNSLCRGERPEALSTKSEILNMLNVCRKR